MEMRWQGLKHDDDLPISPDGHQYELAATEWRVASGEEIFMDWEVAKK